MMVINDLLLFIRLVLPHSVSQTYIDIGTARGVAKIVTCHQNSPQRNATEVCVSPGATPRCAQVHRPGSLGAQSMDASRPRQHT